MYVKHDITKHIEVALLLKGALPIENSNVLTVACPNISATDPKPGVVSVN